MFCCYFVTYLPLHGELHKGFSTFLISMAVTHSGKGLEEDHEEHEEVTLNQEERV